MKSRHVYIGILFLFALSICSYAVEISVIGPIKYTRQAGKPSVFTATFPGDCCQGTLIVKNGSPSGDYRVSSATISINNETIFDTSHFNQNVHTLQLSVQLADKNIIAVELRSEPESYLTIEVKAQVYAEAGAVIDTAGGLVEVNNPSSDLNGVRILVPAGAVSEPSLFLIKVAPVPPIAIPDGTIAYGSPISLTCSSTLLNPVLSEIPFSFSSDEELRLLFHFNEATMQYDKVDPLPGVSNSTMLVELKHFSIFVRIIKYLYFKSLLTNFDMKNDVLSTRNDGTCQWGPIAWDLGICTGMSTFTENYYNNYLTQFGEHLLDRWNPTTSYDLACQVQGRFFTFVGTWPQRLQGFISLLNYLTGNILNYTFHDHSFLIDSIKWDLSNDTPRSVQMVGTELFTNPKLHCSLVIGWQETGDAESFILYDVNDNCKSHLMTINDLGLRKLVTYNDYKYFTLMSPNAFSIADLVETEKDGDGILYGCGTFEYEYEVAYTSNIRGSNDIWISSPNGINKMNLSAVSHDPHNIYSETDACWSPDGKKIAFTSNKSGCSNIWIMDADGTNSYNLTNSSFSRLMPSWSNDGSKICYVGNKYYGDGGGCAPCPHFEIYIYNLVTNSAIQVTNNSYRDMSPVFSPDDNYLALTRAERSNDCCNPTDLWLINLLNGTETFVHGESGLYEWTSRWGKLTNRILFAKMYSGYSYEVTYINPDGTGLTRLTSSSSYDVPVSYSPTEDKILVLSNRDGQYDLWIMDITGNFLQKLTDDSAMEYGGDWKRF